MKVESEKLGDIGYFFTKLMLVSIVIIFTYHFTIGITLYKIDKISDVAVWFQNKVDNLDTFTTIKGIDKFIKFTKLTEGEQRKLRNSTKEILINFSPIIDEVLDYKIESEKQ